MSAKKKTIKKVAAKKAAKVAPKKVAKKAVVKKAVKKVAKKKPIPAKKAAVKKAIPTKQAKKVAVAKTPKPPAAKPVETKPPAPSSPVPMTKARETRNNVREPAAHSVGGKLWAIADKLKQELGRDPARFEFRKACASNEEKFDPASVSFSWFQWRKFNGVAARASGINPKRGTFEVNAK